MKSSTGNSMVLNRSSSCLFDWLSNHRPMIGSRNHLWLLLYIVCWFLFYFILFIAECPALISVQWCVEIAFTILSFLDKWHRRYEAYFCTSQNSQKRCNYCKWSKTNVIYWIASVRAEIICGSLITSVCVSVEFRHLLLYVSSRVREDFILVKCNCGVLNCDSDFDCFRLDLSLIRQQICFAFVFP
jgi:hypothetical protein